MAKTKKMEKTKIKQTFQRVLAGTPPPPSKEFRNIAFFVFFPRFLPSVGYFKEIGMNHRQSCQSTLGNAIKHLKISA